jgi:UDP-3-O-acyl-N-acetylglucosamine deacetylase
VKQDDLGEYEENVREKKNIQYTEKIINSPSNQAIRMTNTNFSPQISKARSIEGFGEDISQLSFGVYVSHLNVSLLYMITQEVVSPHNMPHLFMKD